MQTIQIVLALAVVAAASAGVASGPAAAGPTLEEWKAHKAADQAVAEAAAAKQSKMAAVDQVITLMQGLKAQIYKEGTDEAHTYDKFACFCKDTTVEKSDAIELGQDTQTGLAADIAEVSTFRAEVDKHIEELRKLIEDAEKEIAKATAKRQAEKAVYATNEADFIASFEALDAALGVLKSSKAATASFLQLQDVAGTVRQALSLADALGLARSAQTSRMLTAFLQQDPSVPMQDYDFHGDSIIETLEKLKEDFRNEKHKVDAAEVTAQHEYDVLLADKRDVIKTADIQLAEAKGKRGKAIDQLEALNQNYRTVSAQILDDQDYMTKLSKMCHDTATTWDQRVKMRADELATLTSAIKVVEEKVTVQVTGSTVRLLQMAPDASVAQAVAGDEDLMEAIEARVEDDESPESFVQVAMAPRRLLSTFMEKHTEKPASAKELVIETLRTEGNKLKSLLLLRLASQLAADPFAKVKKLIQELIERLLAEATAEANQKGWCDKSISDAEVKRKYAAEKIADLNAEIATLEATRNKLVEEMAVLQDEIAALKAGLAKAQKLRASEAAENANTIETAKVGVTGIQLAIGIISKFYKTAAKAAAPPVPMSFAPAAAGPAPAAALLQAVQGPLEVAPDPGFEAFDAYRGAQGSAGGILGMMEVIKSDFERTVRLTTEQEAKAQKEFQAYVLETKISLAEKEQALKEKQGYLDDAKEALTPAQDKLSLQAGILKKALTELIELQPACVDTGMSYAERVAMREAEIAGLKKALCILENFEEYGPDGTGSSCD